LRRRKPKLFPTRGVKLPCLSTRSQSFVDVAFGQTPPKDDRVRQVLVLGRGRGRRPFPSKAAVLRLVEGMRSGGGGRILTCFVVGSTCTMASSPLSVNQGAPSGPTMTPCGRTSCRVECARSRRWLGSVGRQCRGFGPRTKSLR